MDTINNDDEIRFTMRMEKELYEKLKESAKVNKRSIAKELEFIVELQFNNPQDLSNQIQEIKQLLAQAVDDSKHK